jgi:hypothetical protein
VGSFRRPTFFVSFLIFFFQKYGKQKQTRIKTPLSTRHHTTTNKEMKYEKRKSRSPAKGCPNKQGQAAAAAAALSAFTSSSSAAPPPQLPLPPPPAPQQPPAEEEDEENCWERCCSPVFCSPSTSGRETRAVASFGTRRRRGQKKVRNLPTGKTEGQKTTAATTAAAELALSLARRRIAAAAAQAAQEAEAEAAAKAAASTAAGSGGVDVAAEAAATAGVAAVDFSFPPSAPRLASPAKARAKKRNSV